MASANFIMTKEEHDAWLANLPICPTCQTRLVGFVIRDGKYTCYKCETIMPIEEIRKLFPDAR